MFRLGAIATGEMKNLSGSLSLRKELWLDGWMDGWMDVCMYVCMYGRRTQSDGVVLAEGLCDLVGRYHFD
jgi:hypothetical protein